MGLGDRKQQAAMTRCENCLPIYSLQQKWASDCFMSCTCLFVSSNLIQFFYNLELLNIFSFINGLFMFITSLIDCILVGGLWNFVQSSCNRHNGMVLKFYTYFLQNIVYSRATRISMAQGYKYFVFKSQILVIRKQYWF